MSLQYILDGYNIIKCSETMADCSLEDGRNMLLRILAHDRPQGSSRNQVTVVFDGRDDVWGQQKALVAKVIFTSGETADDYIKRFIDEARDLKNTVVVTNDGELAYYARTSGAKVLSVEKFLSLEKASSKSSKKNQERLTEPKRITRAAAGKINKEMEDIWIRKKQ